MVFFSAILFVLVLKVDSNELFTKCLVPFSELIIVMLVKHSFIFLKAITYIFYFKLKLYYFYLLINLNNY